MPMELILLALALAFAYFMIIRPMRRQVVAQATMRSELEPGSRVMLTSGIYGTVRHLGQQQAILELAPGLDVTVTTAAISKVVRPEDEEFEYEDEDEDGVVAPTQGDVLPDPAEDSALVDDPQPEVDSIEEQYPAQRFSPDAPSTVHTTDQNRGQ